MLRDDAAVYNKKNRLENLFITLEKNPILSQRRTVGDG